MGQINDTDYKQYSHKAEEAQEQEKSETETKEEE